MPHYLESILLNAIKEGNIVAVQGILNTLTDNWDNEIKGDSGFNPSAQDIDGNTFLILALELGHKEIAKQLLLFLKEKNPATIKLFNNNNRSALWYAADKNYVDIMTELIMLDDPVIDILDNINGTTALSMAAKNGELDIIKKLTKQKQGIENTYLADNQKFTPLHYACQSGHTKTVEFLSNLTISLPIGNSKHSIFDIDAINAMTDEGDTPLHLACKNNHPKIIHILLAKKAYPGLLNNNHQTAIELAIEGNHEEAIAALAQGGALIGKDLPAAVTKLYQFNLKRDWLFGTTIENKDIFKELFPKASIFEKFAVVRLMENDPAIRSVVLTQIELALQQKNINKEWRTILKLLQHIEYLSQFSQLEYGDGEAGMIAARMHSEAELDESLDIESAIDNTSPLTVIELNHERAKILSLIKQLEILTQSLVKNHNKLSVAKKIMLVMICLLSVLISAASLVGIFWIAMYEKQLDYKAAIGAGPLGLGFILALTTFFSAGINICCAGNEDFEIGENPLIALTDTEFMQIKDLIYILNDAYQQIYQNDSNDDLAVKLLELINNIKSALTVQALVNIINDQVLPELDILLKALTTQTIKIKLPQTNFFKKAHAQIVELEDVTENKSSEQSYLLSEVIIDDENSIDDNKPPVRFGYGSISS